jgi:nuclear protein 1
MSNAEVELEKYEFEHDKHMFSGHSGKQRSKTEAAKHTNHHDPNGHSRKIVTKLVNTEKNSQKKESKN